jgi:hypothetical protein
MPTARIPFRPCSASFHSSGCRRSGQSGFTLNGDGKILWSRVASTTRMIELGLGNVRHILRVDRVEGASGEVRDVPHGLGQSVIMNEHGRHLSLVCWVQNHTAFNGMAGATHRLLGNYPDLRPDIYFISLSPANSAWSNAGVPIHLADSRATWLTRSASCVLDTLYDLSVIVALLNLGRTHGFRRQADAACARKISGSFPRKRDRRGSRWAVDARKPERPLRHCAWAGIASIGRQDPIACCQNSPELAPGSKVDQIRFPLGQIGPVIGPLLIRLQLVLRVTRMSAESKYPVHG